MKINIYVIIEFINNLARYKYLIFFLSIQFQETKFVLTHRNTHPNIDPKLYVCFRPIKGQNVQMKFSEMSNLIMKSYFLTIFGTFKCFL